MEFLLSVVLNHSVWAQASLRIPSGKLEGERDDVCSTAVPGVVQLCFSPAWSRRAPLRPLSSAGCPTGAALTAKRGEERPQCAS